MTKCIECSNMTTYENWLCYSCYQKKQKSHVYTDNHPSGLSYNDWIFHYNMIKGRIAETLIQELFLQLKFNVYRYGMENTIPGIMELLRHDNSSVASSIRSMPDFVIQNSTSKEIRLLEVKFRANGSFKINELIKNYPWEDAYIILVSKVSIKCITYKELKEGGEITATSDNHLYDRIEFSNDKAVIIEFCNFATRFFACVN